MPGDCQGITVTLIFVSEETSALKSQYSVTVLLSHFDFHAIEAGSV